MKKHDYDDLCINPEARLCPIFDETSIKMYPMCGSDQMGFRVLDNFPEEHIQ